LELDDDCSQDFNWASSLQTSPTLDTKDTFRLELLIHLFSSLASSSRAFRIQNHT
jgi:hypothetical protein